MNIETALVERIATLFEKLKGMDVGSEEYKATVDTLVKLMDRMIEIEKVHIEKEDKEESRENDKDLKLKQMKDDRIDKFIRNGLIFGKDLGGFLLTVWGAHQMFKFEETGRITSTVGMKVINKMFSWLK